MANIHGNKVSHRAPVIAHLMYVDDLVVCCRAGSRDAAIFKKFVQKYGEWSGQEVNMEKASILFSKNTLRTDKRTVLEIRRFKEIGQNSIYLGSSLVMGRNISKEYGKIKDRIIRQLEGSNRQLLSKIGKAILIRSLV